MKNRLTRPPMHWIAACGVVAFTGLGLSTSLGSDSAWAQTKGVEEAVTANGVAPVLALTPAQRSAIYQEAHRDRSKVAPSRFATNVGADVPPMIELYALPDDVLAENPAAQYYKFTKVDDQVVLVDPTRMRVVAVIGPQSGK
jgi:Protein of unknown function (DUF1236)